MTQMKLELRNDLTVDELAAMSARGDYMSDSLVGKGFEEVMEGTEKDHQEFLNDKAYRGHFGVFEHTSPAFFIEGLSRVAMAQLTRHRHLSFDVQSQRYVNFEDKSPVIPPSFHDTEKESVYYGDADRGRSINFADRLVRHWEESIYHYDKALKAGIPKEDARFFLPQATPVNMTMSGNNRALMHLMDLRKNQKAQWEAQQFSQKVYDELMEYAPKTFTAYEEKTNNNSLRAP
jgi:thymidylate synthase (FAD)